MYNSLFRCGENVGSGLELTSFFNVTERTLSDIFVLLKYIKRLLGQLQDIIFAQTISPSVTINEEGPGSCSTAQLVKTEGRLSHTMFLFKSALLIIVFLEIH